MQAYRKDFPVPDINRQFGKLTDRTEPRSLISTASSASSLTVQKTGPELAEGARAPLFAMSCGFGNRLLMVFLVLQA